MRIPPQALTLVKSFEGFSPTVYKCSAGVDTIGYGHALRKGESFSHITEDEALELLAQDMQSAAAAVDRLIRVPLNDNQLSALISWTFNLGSGALQRSTLRMRLNRGEYWAVPMEMMKWTRARGRVVKGLVRRRQAEAALWLLPDTEHSWLDQLQEQW